MNDLFAKPKTKKEQVYDFIAGKKRCRTSEVIAFGLSIYHTRAERDARDLADEGRIWRVKDSVKLSIEQYKDAKEEIWSVYPADREF